MEQKLLIDMMKLAHSDYQAFRRVLREMLNVDFEMREIVTENKQASEDL